MSNARSVRKNHESMVEGDVRERYANAAANHEAALCCPVDYDAKYLKAIPDEVIEKDYGCGDPSKWLHPGETVLDLGSGAGKICFIASQVVGPTGKVIGVDFNEPMLALARKHRPTVSANVGHDNVEFRKGRIQDLKLDLIAFEDWLVKHPVRSADDFLAMEQEADRLRTTSPLVADESIDCIVSNCVLNLVKPQDKAQLFAEMFRVLKRGGRCVISDIVSDEDIPAHLRDDANLWSGCISGAYREDAFIKAFEDAGFHGMEIVARQAEPWQTIEGIEFRSITVRAYKGKQGPCLDRNQGVIYKGPWKAVVDDDGHTLYRGERMAVCDKTYKIYTHGPYAESIIPVDPLEEIPLDSAKPYDCRRNARRTARETKGLDYAKTEMSESGPCGDGDCC